MTAARAYLRIPDEYCRSLGGLRWSTNGEAVDYDSADPQVNCTFVLAPEIAIFLEGFASSRSLINFGFVLHLLHLLGGAYHARPRASDPLAAAFRGAQRPLRNAGALCAALCAELPAANDSPSQRELSMLLYRRHQEMFGHDRGVILSQPGEVPPLPPATFEAAVLNAVAALSAEDIRHWLRYGRGPVHANVDEAIDVRPRSLDRVLKSLLNRPRLSSSAAMVSVLEGAVELPARSLSSSGLASGGYADVTTRGLPEQILPTQLALDADEFVRRFASRELLYFHRETPRAPVSEELVVVIDQGVRTWGSVRLILNAVALALGRRASRRGVPFLVATTGNEGLVLDPLHSDDETLGELFDASDLSPHPGLALERVLEEHSERFRDVVLLTHPRNLAEPDVAAAARRAAAGARLFAIAVDSAGLVDISEVRRGSPIVLSRCRVPITEPVAPTEPSSAPGNGIWHGDVESPGFPFCLGLLFGKSNDRLIDFDEAGDWLLAAGPYGLLHAWRVDGTGMEMLPRAEIDGNVMSEIEAIVGVANGFVVIGRFSDVIVAAHYHFPSRFCTVHLFGPTVLACGEWIYARHLHSIIARNGPVTILALDLAAKPAVARYPSTHQQMPCSDRAVQAFRESPEVPSPAPTLVAEGCPIPNRGRAIRVNPKSGELEVKDDGGVVRRTIPLADGQPLLKGTRVRQARVGGDTLAMLVGDSTGTGLHLFSRGSNVPIGMFATPDDVTGFALSRDGRLYARRVRNRTIEIREVGSPMPRLLTAKGESHFHLDVYLGDAMLLVRTGKHVHIIQWSTGTLECSLTSRKAPPMSAREFAAASEGKLRASVPLNVSSHDRRRFRFSCTGDVKILFDVVGQISVLDLSDDLVCMFFVFRDQIAAWMPDGTRLGPIPIIGGAPSPNAAERIGSALLAASERGHAKRRLT